MGEITKIGVVGAGQMGNGIAHVAACAGFDVCLTDIHQDALDRAVATIEKNLARMLKKEKITEADAAAALARIQCSTDMGSVSSSHLVVEAATENVDLKYKIFESLSDVAAEDAILASNTSSISITSIAAKAKNPERVMGMHFMNPVPVMKLVELIRGLQTSDATFAAVEAAAQKMGKTTIVARDVPGFLVNRILMPYLNEACQALYEGIGTVEDIDTGMTLGTNVPMGPFTLADFIGLDTCLAICEVLYNGLGDDKYAPSPLLRKYVEAGWLGRKSGRGFYVYNQG
jgi:3-hydroxybutyryl-CoA dehydrogenase